MAFTKYTALLAFGMLITGTLNTISTTWANNMHAEGTMGPATIWGKLDKEDGKDHAFDHPFFQAVCMFLGEFLCLVAHILTKKERTPTLEELQADQNNTDQTNTSRPESSGCRQARNGSFLFALPALCDMCGTGVMYAGLCLSYASVFQMLRSAVVVFTALISCIALKRKIYAYQWTAVGCIVIGVLIVSLGGKKDPGAGKDATGVMIGNILIIFAQAIVGVQMCVEEKIMSIYKTPALKAVGLEGSFGCIFLGLGLIPMYYIHIEGVPFENAPDAIAQLGNNPMIILAMSGNILSIAFFNFFGISITKNMSAAHRMVLDSVRTMLVWAISLSLGWETFQPLQLLGFAVLTFAIFMYNEVIVLSKIFKYPELANHSSVVSGTDHGSFLADQEKNQRLLQAEGGN